MEDNGLIAPTDLKHPEALEQLRNSNTALTALRVSGPVNDAGAQEIVEAAVDSDSVTLRKLVLYCKQLTEVPYGVWRLTNLEELVLQVNLIPSVPAEVGSLEVLRVLDLYNNQLEAVPAELSKLTNLMLLDLYRNRLTSLPATFTHLTNLITLDLACAAACVVVLLDSGC
jgi:Leucine-rich repeat (LRR) protein